MQTPGVLDGQHVGGLHHLAQPRADVAGLPQGRTAQHQPSRHAGACHGGDAAPVTTLTCMAVLAPEREEREPPPVPPRRRPPPAAPRPRRDRTPPLPGDTRLSWLLTAALGVLTLVSRLSGIGYPSELLFDEAYYPPEAAELLRWGYEYNRGYTFIVHPPLGKWLIATGQALFGNDSFGWRFPSAVAGTIAVVVLVRLARRLTGSTFLGLLAGLLLALDGFSFTLARIGLLDVFLQVLVLSAVACLVVDRDRVRARIDAAGERAADGFRLGPRGWRIAAGFLFGCACAVKWSGIWFLAFFAVASLVWDRAAWREAGAPRPTRRAARYGLPGAVWALGAVPVLTYLASFTGWFLGETSQGRRGRSRTRRPPSRSSPTRCARCGTSTPSGCASTTDCRRRTRGSRAPGRGWSTAGRSCCGTRRTSPTTPASRWSATS